MYIEVYIYIIIYIYDVCLCCLYVVCSIKSYVWNRIMFKNHSGMKHPRSASWQTFRLWCRLFLPWVLLSHLTLPWPPLNHLVPPWQLPRTWPSARRHFPPSRCSADRCTGAGGRPTNPVPSGIRSWSLPTQSILGALILMLDLNIKVNAPDPVWCIENPMFWSYSIDFMLGCQHQNQCSPFKTYGFQCTRPRLVHWLLSWMSR